MFHIYSFAPYTICYHFDLTHFGGVSDLSGSLYSAICTPSDLLWLSVCVLIDIWPAFEVIYMYRSAVAAVS